MQAALDPAGRPVEVDDITITAPGFSGIVETLPPTKRSRTRAAGRQLTDLDRALGKARMTTTHVVSVGVTGRTTRRTGTRGAGSKGTGKQVVLDVPLPAEGWEQVVLSVDEHGVTRWHFGKGDSPAAGATRRSGARGTRRYEIPVTGRVSARATAAGRRVPVGDFIKKRVIQVVAFKVGKYVGAKARDMARDWERKNRPDGIRSFEPGTFSSVVPYFDQDNPAWLNLAKGRSLLFIHGTFGRIHTAMSAFPEDLLKRLHVAYAGRVFAFDHRTVSDDPEINARWFIDHVPPNVELELDIVCHSRGGLVARTLAERASQLGGSRIKVRRIALVAVPSEGTILASVKNWNRLLDTFTSLVSLAPGPGLADAADVILAVVRQIVVTGYEEIHGLYCMMPESPFLETLNGQSRSGAIYYGMASNYEPDNADLKALIQDEALDRLHGKPNDMLVSIPSAIGSPKDRRKAPFASVDEKFVLEPPGSIEHSSYFGRPDLMSRLVTWLEGGLP